MTYGDSQGSSWSIASAHAPWRRGARPLVILFTLQLSGAGCAARAPSLSQPERPGDMSAYLKVYEAQLAGQGIELEDAEDYVTGRGGSPLAATDDAATPEDVDAPSAAALSGQGPAQVGEETYKIIDGVAEYRIGPGDLVLVTSYLGPEQPAPTVYRVQADGTLYIARFGIGTIQASGLTPSELTRTLTDAFREFVPGGYVEARMQEYHAWHATLTGEINIVPDGGPGSYVLDGRTTVSDFIYEYGGPTSSGDLGDVRILRGDTQQRIDVASVLAGNVADVPLRSGDVVLVPSIEQGSSRIFIFGEVREPGVYTYTEGISVLDAIAQAGGYTQTAKRADVYISRPSANAVIPVDLDTTLSAGEPPPALEPGDFVVVPFSPDRSQIIRDWVGVFGLVLTALTAIELVRRD